MGVYTNQCATFAMKTVIIATSLNGNCFCEGHNNFLKDLFSA